MSALGYKELKKEQEEIILRFISGNDVFGVLPTGFGKSLCYTCFEESLSNKRRSLTFNASPQARQMTAIHSRFSSHEDLRSGLQIELTK